MNPTSCLAFLRLIISLLMVLRHIQEVTSTNSAKKLHITNYQGDLEQATVERLLHNYDWRVRPVGSNTRNKNGGPVMVKVNLYLRTISAVDDVNMQYHAHFTFREEWMDPRLAFSSTRSLKIPKRPTRTLENIGDPKKSSLNFENSRKLNQSDSKFAQQCADIFSHIDGFSFDDRNRFYTDMVLNNTRGRIYRATRAHTNNILYSEKRLNTEQNPGPSKNNIFHGTTSLDNRYMQQSNYKLLTNTNRNYDENKNSHQNTYTNSTKETEMNRRRHKRLHEHPEVAEKKFQIKYVHLPPSDTNIKIWMPDTFFQNEKDGKKHTIDKPNVMLRVYPNGHILYSIRMTLTLSCPMILQSYPMDTQECYIDLASYAYTTEDIKYYWKVMNPVQVKAGLKQSLPSFTLTDVRTTLCTSKTNTGEYSCLRTILVLKREFSYYLLQLYIPSLMLVVVSWVSFWLDKDSVPARVTLGVTTLLTMTTQASGINAKLPPVSYTKAIDVWIGVCLAFIFGALLEFALVNYAARKDLMDEIYLRGRRRSIDVESIGRRKQLSNEPLIRRPTPENLTYSLTTEPSSLITNPTHTVDFNFFMRSTSEPYSYRKKHLTPARQLSYHTDQCQYAPSRDQAYFNTLLSTEPSQQHHCKDLVQPGIEHLGQGITWDPYLNKRLARPHLREHGHRQAFEKFGPWEKYWKPYLLKKWFAAKYRTRSKRIDVVSRICFPTSFAIFNLVYWVIYMIPYVNVVPNDDLLK